MAETAGFEPANMGVKVPCLTAWRCLRILGIKIAMAVLPVMAIDIQLKWVQKNHRSVTGSVVEVIKLMGAATVTAPESLELWQAYHPPASLGLPLSIPSACGRYEIYHLKVPSYPTHIVAQLFCLVKNLFILNQSFPFLFSNF